MTRWVRGVELRGVSRLNAADTIRQIADEVDAIRTDAVVLGRVRGARFDVIARHARQSGGVITLSGEVGAAEGGSFVRARVGLSYMAAAIFGGWTVVTIVLFAAMATVLLTTLIRRGPVAGVLPFFGLASVVLLLPYVRLRSVLRDGVLLRDWFEQRFGASQ
jgi:hypothetical protein